MSSLVSIFFIFFTSHDVLHIFITKNTTLTHNTPRTLFLVINIISNMYF